MAYSLAYTNLSSHYLGTFDVLREQSRLGTCAQTREQVHRISEVLLLGIRLCAAQLGTPKQINDLVDTRMYEIMTEHAAFEPVPAELCTGAEVVGADLGSGMAALRISPGSGEEEEDKSNVPQALPWPGNTPATAHKPTSGFSSSSSSEEEEVHSSSTMRDWAELMQDRSIAPSGPEPNTYVFQNLDVYKDDSLADQRFFRHVVQQTLDEVVRASGAKEVEDVANAFGRWVEQEVPDPDGEE
jgi:hypothetical protein